MHFLPVTSQALIQPITNSPGIFYDSSGTVKIIRDYTHILVPMDISFATSHIENIKAVVGTIRYMCQQSEAIHDIECNNMIQPFDALFKDIIRDYNAVSHLLPTHSKRSAWFSAVGTVFKHVFGTLDEDDALKYNRAIRKLQNSDKELATSLSRNIFVSKAAISNFNSSILQLNKNQFLLNDAMEKISVAVKNISEITNSIYFRNNLNEILNVLQAHLLTFSFKMEDIVNSILFAKTNTLHPSILTPQQLLNELMSNFKNLPKHQELPMDLNLDNIHSIIYLSDIVTYFLNDKLIFVIKIPMVDLTTYNLFKCVSIPVPHDSNKPNSFALITPHKPYIGLSEDRKTYFYINNLDNMCKTIISKHFMCKSIDVLNIMTNPTCETDILTKTIDTLPNNCKTNFIFGYIDIWHKLNGNKWIFTQSNPTKLTIECNSSHVRDDVITGTGILTLEPGCTAFCKETKLETKENTKITTNPIVTNFNIINDSCCNLYKFSKLNINISSAKIENVNLDNIELINYNIPDQILNDDDNTLPDDTILNYTGFCISIVTIIVVISVIVKISNKCSFKRNKRNESVPENIPLPSLTPNTPPLLRAT